MDKARGMSLIEVLVVVGMLTFCIATGMIVTTKDLTVGSARTDRNYLEDALMLARSRSALSTGSYGVSIRNDSFMVFEEYLSDPDTRRSTTLLPHDSAVILNSDTPLFFKKGSPRNPASYSLDEKLIVEVSERGRIVPGQTP